VGLLSLLALPITGPAKAGWWLLHEIAAEAEAELYDANRLRKQLAELHEALDRGEIDEQAYEAAEEELLERMMETRRREAAQAAEAQEGTLP
jgi:cytochrome c-type biogenesis protein CcmI